MKQDDFNRKNARGRHVALWIALSALLMVLVLAAVIFVAEFVFAPKFNLPLPAINGNDNVPQARYDAKELAPFLVIDAPRPGEKLSSPLKISGKARTWYFEGSFPLELRDGNGKVIAMGQATAAGDWMTDAFVPFTATLEFAKPSTAAGVLVFKKDNPSGLPEHDAAFRAPILFAMGGESPPALLACKPTGCSGQICSDEAKISDCLYLPEYACYKTARCERQSDGACGWTPTVALKSCLDKARQ